MWRRAVAEAANDLVDATQAGSFNAYDAELVAMRRTLIEAGAAPEDLSPVTPRFDPNLAIAMLKGAGRPTAVFYSIRLDDTVRFILAAADGIREIAVAASEQAVIVGEADAYVQALRSESGPLVAKVEKHLPTLIARSGPALAPALDQTLEQLDGGRLLWVPHGSLVAIPLLACPTKLGVVVDRVSVIIAPSLSLGLESLLPDVTVPRHAAAISGRSDRDEAPTDGGERLLAPLVPSAVRDIQPSSLAALERAVGSATVVQVTCHGVYDWSDPLVVPEARTGVRPVGRQPLRLVALRVRFARRLRSLRLGNRGSDGHQRADHFGVAAMAAGARTVIGAVWPVRYVVAVGFCARFVRELAKGAASPEALKAATIWIRDATYDSLLREVERVGHPLADQLRRIDPARRGVKPCGRPEMWASCVDWGRGWRGAPAER